MTPRVEEVVDTDLGAPFPWILQNMSQEQTQHWNIADVPQIC